MRAVALLLLLAACAPDPFGEDCRTSPSCQKREAKKRRAAQNDTEKRCKANGQMFLVDENAPLACNTAAHCEGVTGCPANMQCDSTGTHCLSGDSWAGYCGVCAAPAP